MEEYCIVCSNCDWEGTLSDMDYNPDTACLYCPECSLTLVENYYEITL